MTTNKKKDEAVAEEAAPNPLETEFFEDNRAATNPPAGIDDRTGFLQSDGKELFPDPKVRDEVLYCIGFKDTGEKGEDGNRILEPEYAPATIYEVDEERTATGHVLLVYTAPGGGQKLPAYAHNAEGVPGYWTHNKTKEPK
jgi:hypothetical protein